MSMAINGNLPSAVVEPLEAASASEPTEMQVDAVLKIGGLTVSQLEELATMRQYETLFTHLASHHSKWRARPKNSALLLACATPGLARVVNIILNDPASPQFEKINTAYLPKADSKHPMSAIHYAKDRDTARVLLEHGCNLQSYKGKNPLELAFYEKNYGVVDALIAHNPIFPMKLCYLNSRKEGLSKLACETILNLLNRLPSKKSQLDQSTYDFLFHLDAEQKQYLFETLPRNIMTYPILSYLFYNIPSKYGFWDRQIANNSITREIFSFPTAQLDFLHALLHSESFQFPFEWLLQNTDFKQIKKDILEQFLKQWNTTPIHHNNQEKIASLLASNLISRKAFYEIFNEHIPLAQRTFPKFCVEMSESITYDFSKISHLDATNQHTARLYILKKYGDKLEDPESICNLAIAMCSNSANLRDQDKADLVLLTNRLLDPSKERSRVLHYAAASNNFTLEQLRLMAGNHPEDLFLNGTGTIEHLLVNRRHELLELFEDKFVESYIANVTASGFGLFHKLIQKALYESASALKERVGDVVLANASTVTVFLYLHDLQESEEKIKALEMLSPIVQRCKSATQIHGIEMRIVNTSKSPLSEQGKNALIDLSRGLNYSSHELIQVCEQWIPGLAASIPQQNVNSWHALQELVSLQTEANQHALRTQSSALTFYAAFLQARVDVPQEFKEAIQALFSPREGEVCTFGAIALESTLNTEFYKGHEFTVENPVLAMFENDSALFQRCVENDNKALLEYLLARFGWPVSAVGNSCLFIKAIKRNSKLCFPCILRFIKEHSLNRTVLEQKDAWGNSPLHLAADSGDATMISGVISLVSVDLEHMINEQNREESATPVALYVRACITKRIPAKCIPVFYLRNANFTIPTNKGHIPLFGLRTIHDRSPQQPEYNHQCLVQIYLKYICEQFPSIFKREHSDQLKLQNLRRIVYTGALVPALISINPAIYPNQISELYAMLDFLCHAEFKAVGVLNYQYYSLEEKLSDVLYSLGQSSGLYTNGEETSTFFQINFNSDETFLPILQNIENLDKLIAENPEEYSYEELEKLVDDDHVDSKVSLQALQQKVKNRVAYLGTPPESEKEALEFFYQFFEKSLKRVVYFCKKSLENDASELNRVNIQHRLMYLAERSEYCATAAVWASFESIDLESSDETTLSSKDRMAKELYLLLTNKAMTALGSTNVHHVGQGYALVAEKYKLLPFPVDTTVKPLSAALKKQVLDICSPLAIVSHLSENPDTDGPIYDGYVKAAQASGDQSTYFDEDYRILPKQMKAFLEEQGILKTGSVNPLVDQENAKRLVIAQHKLAMWFDLAAKEAYVSKALELFKESPEICKQIESMHKMHPNFNCYSHEFLKQFALKHSANEELAQSGLKKARLDASRKP